MWEFPENPYWPSPGARVAWWLSFRQENFPLEHDGFIIFLTYRWTIEEWRIVWAVDGAPPTHGGSSDEYVDVAILSTDTAAQVAQKTFDALVDDLDDWSNYRPGNVALVNVVAGDRYTRLGLPPGPAILWRDATARATQTAVPGGHEIAAAIFTTSVPPGGTLAHPYLPVEYYPLESPQGSYGLGMLSYGQAPVYALPARFGLNRAVLPIGDLPNRNDFEPQPL
jgi:hypothetical protein